MILKFDKVFKNDKYEILFNTKSGLEISRGINGHDDPFVMQMASLLDIGVMGTCKHKCPFCYQGHTDRPNMPLLDFKRIIDETHYHVNQVALGGRGDPNHHENFREIVEYCRSKNVVPNYTTSGIGITNEQIEISKLCGAVAISDYEQDYTYKAIDSFIKAGIKTNIHQIFSKESFDKCFNIIQGQNPDIWNFDISSLNAVIFLLFKPHGAGKNLDWKPTAEQVKLFGENIYEPKSKFKIGMDSCLVNHILQYGNPTRLQKASLDTCEAARMSAYITPDMKFMPCSFANELLWSVPIKESLHEIWENGEPFKTFRKTLANKNNCCPLGL
jgi:MoaA/NifB/PqqE/SkfB family radical SAM enzyme